MNYPLLRIDIDVEKNYSGLFRILRTLIVVGIFVTTAFFVDRKYFFSGIIIALLLWVLLDVYGRRLLPDWPTGKKNEDVLILGAESIKTRKKQIEQNISIEEIRGVILFCDHYKGYSGNHLDLRRNGNSLFFIELRTGFSQIIKFNIPGPVEYTALMEQMKSYSIQIDYSNIYATSMIATILNKEMTYPKKYKKTSANQCFNRPAGPDT